MVRILIEAGSMLVVVGIVWGDLTRQLKDIKFWAKNHNRQAEQRDIRITQLEIDHGKLQQYMADSEKTLNRIESKLDKISSNV